VFEVVKCKLKCVNSTTVVQSKAPEFLCYAGTSRRPFFFILFSGGSIRDIPLC
jgi:hypothetical protein